VEVPGPPTHEDAMTTSELSDTSPHQLAAITAAAAAAAGPLADTSADERAALLHAAADAIDGRADDLVAVAHAETALGEARLRGEVARTTGQLRLFADVVREGSYLEAMIDTPDPAASPPRPDLRRMLRPLGPVAVFAASNFPFAFSVAGGDTASALAAGCPVVVKAHPGHPRLSRAVADLVAEALAGAGAPDGTFALVSGLETGAALVQDPHIRAVGFTGSLAGGRALFDLAAARPDPIPFYGELGSVNPVVVTAAAAAARGAEIARGLVGSFTLGVGQFCTKPGVVLVPADAGMDEHVRDALDAVGDVGGEMLLPRIAEGFRAGVAELAARPDVTVVAGSVHQPEGTAATAVVLASDVAALQRAPDVLLAEVFGPVCLLVGYRDHDELDAAVALLPGSLAMALHAQPEEAAGLAPLLARLQERAGRVVWNGWPTGVAVTWSQHHGGPWPATTAPLHTSVGATAIRRFLRPVVYQDLPADLLPAALRDDNPLGLLRRVNGRLTRDPVGGAGAVGR